MFVWDRCVYFFKSQKTINTNKIIIHCYPTPKPTFYIITKGDSAVSNHYFAIRDKAIVLNVDLNNPTTFTTLLDHSTLQSSLQGLLPI